MADAEAQGERESFDVPDASSAWGVWFIGLFLAAGTIFAIVLGVQRTMLAQRVAEYAEVPGEVTVSTIVERGGSGVQRAQVAVRYEVDGREYTLETGGHDGRAEPAKSPEEFRNRYGVGQEVPVFYDPAKPDDASLTRTVNVTQMWGLAAAGLVLCFGYFWWAWKRTKRLASAGA